MISKQTCTFFFFFFKLIEKQSLVWNNLTGLYRTLTSLNPIKITSEKILNRNCKSSLLSNTTVGGWAIIPRDTFQNVIESLPRRAEDIIGALPTDVGWDVIKPPVGAM